MPDVRVLNGCDGSSVCTTCGGLRMLNVTLMRYEAAVPGYIEALLCEAGRDTDRGSFTVGRVVAAFALLDTASKRRVKHQWKSVARAQPESIPVIAGWLMETSSKIGGEWTTLVRSVVPHLLAQSRWWSGDQQPATRLLPDDVKDAEGELTTVVEANYGERDHTAFRRQLALRSLPFLQRLHLIRALGMSPKGYLSDSINEDELQSMRLPELQQVIDFLLAKSPDDHALPLQQLKRVRSELQDAVRAAVTSAIGELEPVIQLSLIARADALPLAVVDRALAERAVVEQLPTALREELKTRARASSMKWWRRHGRG